MPKSVNSKENIAPSRIEAGRDANLPEHIEESRIDFDQLPGWLTIARILGNGVLWLAGAVVTLEALYRLLVAVL